MEAGSEKQWCASAVLCIFGGLRFAWVRSGSDWGAKRGAGSLTLTCHTCRTPASAGFANTIELK